MFGGMNPRDMQKAMKKLGIKQEEIEAELVIIKTKGKDIVIRNPNIVKMNMMGQESLQVTGDMEELDAQTKPEINEDDIATVMDQTGCSREKAVSALEESEGNIAMAIMNLQK